MDWIYVNSSNLCCIAYDQPNMTLTIQFRDGSTYDYFNVPRFVFDELLNAPSKGRYLHQHIKERFHCQRR